MFSNSEFHLFVLDLHFFGLQLEHWRYFYQQGAFESIVVFGDFVLFQFNAIIYLLAINLIYSSFVLAGVMGILIAIIGYIKLRQILHYINRNINPKSFRLKHVLQFAQIIDVNLRFLRDINRVYGPMLFGFQSINLPLNALIAMLLMSGRVESYKLKLALNLILADQVLIIFVVHLFVAILGARFHRPVKQFVSCSVKCSRRLARNMLVQQKLVRYIELFHTENLFTVNYGNYGKITFASVGKVEEFSH